MELLLFALFCTSALGNALQPINDPIGDVTGEIQEGQEALDTTVDGLESDGSALLGVAGIDQPKGPFQECIANAFSNNAGKYAFPQDVLFPLADLGEYNLDYVVTPGAIVYPDNVQEVSSAVTCANQYGVAVQGRSGGHSYTNNGYGGMNGSLSVNFRNMKGFTYNQQDQTVSIGPGNNLGDMDHKLAGINRVMPYGVVSEIGMGGHVTIGGLGPLSRLHGLAADQVLSAQCVLGNGSIVTASATENPDLLFAIKGAGWSFALVTEFTMQTYPVPTQVVSFQHNITYGKTEEVANVFKAWQKFIADPALSRLFSCQMYFTSDAMIIFGTYLGDEQAFNSLNLESDVLGPAAGLTITSRVVTTAVHDIIAQALDIGGAAPLHFYAKSLKTTYKTLWSDDAVDAIFNYIDTTDKGTPAWFIVWDLGGGAISDISQTATAYWQRDALHTMQSYIINLTGPVTQTSFNFMNGLNKFIQSQVPGIDDSAYPGYVDAQLENYLTAYWGGNVPRLEQIKAEYDSENTFRNPQSVPVAKA